MSKMLVNNVDYFTVKSVINRSYNQDYVDEYDIDLIETFDRNMVVDICKDLVKDHKHCWYAERWYNNKINECYRTNTDLIELAMKAIAKH